MLMMKMKAMKIMMRRKKEEEEKNTKKKEKKKKKVMLIIIRMTMTMMKLNPTREEVRGELWINRA